jgi:hypothetical protein
MKPTDKVNSCKQMGTKFCLLKAGKVSASAIQIIGLLLKQKDGEQESLFRQQNVQVWLNRIKVPKAVNGECNKSVQNFTNPSVQTFGSL